MDSHSRLIIQGLYHKGIKLYQQIFLRLIFIIVVAAAAAAVVIIDGVGGWAHACHSMPVEIRRQLWGVRFLLPQCIMRSTRPMQQALLPTE